MTGRTEDMPGRAHRPPRSAVVHAGLVLRSTVSHVPPKETSLMSIQFLLYIHFVCRSAGRTVHIGLTEVSPLK